MEIGFQVAQAGRLTYPYSKNSLLGTPPIDLPKKPRAGVSPIAFSRRLGNTQHLSRLLDCHSDEIPELNQFRLARVVSGEAVERLVHGDLFVFITAGRGDLHGGVIDVDPLQTTSVTNSFLASGVVNNDAAHGLGGDGEEMRATLPLPTILASKLEPRLMHQSGGLEGLSGSFTGKLSDSEMAKFVVNQLHSAETKGLLFSR